MTKRSMAFAVLSVVGLAAGCVEKSDELTASEREQIKAYISEQAPSPEHELDISFEGKIELLGYDVSRETWKPGEKLEVTWYWKTVRPLEKGWRLFTHIADASGNDRLNQDANGVIRRTYPPGMWKKGEHIRDVQEITLPQDWSSPRAVFYLGIWKGQHRLQVTEGPQDGDNRARALTIDTPSDKAKEKPTAQVPTLPARKVSEAPEIDGKLDEEAWKGTKATRAFVNTMSGGAAEPKTTAKVAWNDTHLFIGFDVADDFLKSEYDERDDTLWKQDAVEMMIDHDGDGKDYVELQVSPKGVVFDTRYDEPRKPKAPGHVDYDSGLEAAVDVRGRVGDDDEDKGYSVEVAIPFSAFGEDEAKVNPSNGDTWRMNFYVMDARPEEGSQRSAGWSPTRVPDFHVPARFGKVRFVDPEVANNAARALRARPEMKKLLQKKVQIKRPEPGLDKPRKGEPMPSPTGQATAK